jgi:hypothetical protein
MLLEILSQCRDKSLAQPVAATSRAAGISGLKAVRDRRMAW